MLANATRICEAKFGILMLRHGDGFRSVAINGAPSAYTEAMTQNPYIPPRPGSGLVVLAQTKQPVQMADLQSEPGYIGNRLTTLAGARTLLIVPLLKDDELVGAVNIYRQELRPFTDKQIALLQNFAAQAVIAIENTRLLNELRQRTTDLAELEQQTATSEVLQVISSSPSELEPVFQAMLENATRICEAKFGLLLRFDGEAFHFAAEIGTPPELAEFVRRRGPFQPSPNTQVDRVMRTKQVSHTTDAAAEAVLGAPAMAWWRAISEVAVPMLKENELIGAISIYRQEVRPFTDKQIALVTNFAAQAVIAIENARLLNELRKLIAGAADGDIRGVKCYQRFTWRSRSLYSTPSLRTRLAFVKPHLALCCFARAMYSDAPLSTTRPHNSKFIKNVPILRRGSPSVDHAIDTGQVSHTLDTAAEDTQRTHCQVRRSANSFRCANA